MKKGEVNKMIIQEIGYIIVCLIALFFTIYFVFIKHQIKKILFLTPLYIIVLILPASLIINYFEYRNYEPEIHQVVFDETLDLSLVESDSRNYLINLYSGKEVTYINVYEKTPYKLKNLHPIYLKDLGDYYVVIYSYDKDKVIKNDRFLQGDYEFFETDILVLIEKETGYIFNTQAYELIGNEIDLNSFQFGENLIVFAVFIKHETNISFYQYINIQDDYSIENSRSLYENYYSDFVSDWQFPAIHEHTLGDPSELVDFKIFGTYIYYQDSYDNLYVGTYNQENYGVRFNFYETLMDEQYAKDGYIKATSTGIYYLSNDLDIYKLVSLTYPMLIEENVSTDDFEAFFDR
jgi:energy-coupling factor transporter transmembrane protein EcfT